MLQYDVVSSSNIGEQHSEAGAGQMKRAIFSKGHEDENKQTRDYLLSMTKTNCLSVLLGTLLRAFSCQESSTTRLAVRPQRNA